jgi:hypothetical protein
MVSMSKRKSVSSVKQARQRLNCGHTKIYQLFAAGKLTPLKLAGRTVIDDDEIDQLIQSLPSAIEVGTIRSGSPKEPVESVS